MFLCHGNRSAARFTTPRIDPPSPRYGGTSSRRALVQPMVGGPHTGEMFHTAYGYLVRSRMLSTDTVTVVIRRGRERGEGWVYLHAMLPSRGNTGIRSCQGTQSCGDIPCPSNMERPTWPSWGPSPVDGQPGLTEDRVEQPTACRASWECLEGGIPNIKADNARNPPYSTWEEPLQAQGASGACASN